MPSGIFSYLFIGTRSIASGVDLLDGRSVPAEAVTSHPVTLEARGIPGLTPDAIPEPHWFGDWEKVRGWWRPTAEGHSRSSPGPGNGPSYGVPIYGPDSSSGPHPAYDARPSNGPGRPPVIYDIRPAPMIHDPAVDLTPGRVPMGQVGPPGSSFFETHKTKIMIGAGVLVVAVAGWFGFKWWKKKKAAAGE
ncbi:hypothetical protein FAUST_8556 [Fusarium austroamericanum]|uniref:Uncharacterized protein n=1 Tax=Fusarium austroamericanum TaxID=282268 RepID=A0AAN5Z4C7_FUSAU|nr:hypothetical protein FAUST_8556 [Fusarium austroamericanum]